MGMSKSRRKSKKEKDRKEKNKKKVLKIRNQLRKDAKDDKETFLMKKEIEKIQFQGITIRGKASE
jgi:uncharacterized membrane-anchored protein